jgi:hypothetical protein
LKSFIGQVLNNKWIFVLFLFGLGLLRFLFTEADPSVLKLTPDLFDEGWWAAPALQKFYCDDWLINEQSGGFVLAPLYNVLLWLWFKSFGAGLVSLRTLHILISELGIAALYGFLHNSWPERAKLGTLLYASSFYLFSFSRLGFPENIQLSLLWLHFALLSYLSMHRKNSLFLFFLGGLLMGLAVGIKVSFLFFIPALVASWLVFIIRFHLRIIVIVGLLLGLCLPIVIHYFFIFQPLQGAFEQQNLWMQLSFPGLETTLSITRIWYWLCHFSLVPFFLHPSNFLLMVLVGISLFKNGYWFTQNFWASAPLGLAIGACFLTVCFILILFSDGSERRLIFLLPGLVLVASALDSGSISAKPWPRMLKVVLGAILLFNTYFWGIKYLGTSSFFNLISPVLGWLFVHPIFFMSIIYFLWWKFEIKAASFPAIKVFAFSAFGLIFLYSSLDWIGINQFYSLDVGLLIFLMFLIIKKGKLGRLEPNFLYSLALLLNIGLILHYLNHPRYSIKALAQKADKILGQAKVAGPNLIFGLAPNCHFSPLYHSDIAIGFEKFYEPQLKQAEFYVDAYPLSQKEYDPSILITTLVDQRKMPTEVMRDTILPQFGNRAEVVVVYALKNYQYGKSWL